MTKTLHIFSIKYFVFPLCYSPKQRLGPPFPFHSSLMHSLSHPIPHKCYLTGEPANTCLNVITNSDAEDMSTAVVAQNHDDEIKTSEYICQATMNPKIPTVRVHPSLPSPFILHCDMSDSWDSISLQPKPSVCLKQPFPFLPRHQLPPAFTAAAE